MTRRLGDQLDRAHDELRAWCHERPDLQNPSSVYSVFGSVTAILLTLGQIIDLSCRAAERATDSDDNRSVPDAAADVAGHGRSATAAIEQAYRSVAAAHGVTSHLVFALAPDDGE
jgi:hypothetical protein